MKILLSISVVFISHSVIVAQSFEWARSLPGSGFVHNTDLTIDPSGNVITCGYFSGTADIDPGEGEFLLTTPDRAGFVSKLDPDGNFIWGLFIDSELYCRARSVKTDDAGNIYVAGTFTGLVDFDPGPNVVNKESIGGQSSFIAKYDADRNLAWVWSFNTIGQGIFRDFVLGDNGDVFMLISVIGNGWTEGSIDLDPGPDVFIMTAPLQNSNSFICKLNESDGFLWARKLGSNSNSPNPNAMTLDQSGNIVIAGSFNLTVDFDPGPLLFTLTSTSITNAFILKLDQNGEFIWVKKFSNSGMDDAYNVLTDPMGRICISGTFQSTTDFDPGSGVFNLPPIGQRDVYVCLLDSEGSFIWAVGIGAEGEYAPWDVPWGLGFDTFGDIYFTANHTGPVSFQNQNGIIQIPTIDDTGYFVCKLSQEGQFELLFTTEANARSLSISTDNDLVIAGYFGGTVDFDPGPGISELTTPPFVMDMFVTKLSQQTLHVDALPEKHLMIKLYPNPTEGLLFADSAVRGLTIELFTIAGVRVHASSLAAFSQVLDLSHLPAGIYLARVKDESGLATVQKIVLR